MPPRSSSNETTHVAYRDSIWAQRRAVNCRILRPRRIPLTSPNESSSRCEKLTFRARRHRRERLRRLEALTKDEAPPAAANCAKSPGCSAECYRVTRLKQHISRQSAQSPLSPPIPKYHPRIAQNWALCRGPAGDAGRERLAAGILIRRPLGRTT
jgi:hypothetical protein